TPFIAPSYSPELEFLVSAGGLYTFKTDKKDPILERSSLPFSVGYSSNGSLQITGILTLYGRHDRTRSIGEFWLKNMPDNYWGVGYENGRNVERSDSTTAYDRDWWKIYYKLVRRFGKHLFVGGIVDINKTKASNLNPVMTEDPDILDFGTSVRNSGLGFAVQYDSRDLIVNAYKGVFVDISTIFYGNFLGGENKYQAVQIDYRQYLNMGKERRTLAWQVKTRATFSDAPWPELSQFGNPFDLRGYRWGRFRDESMLFGLVEYRHMFNRKKPNKKGSYQSRSGFTAWVGGGTLGKDFGDFGNWLPNYGIGYRLETQPRMNVRIDYGFGVDSNAIYVTFNEAF
ncbi:MAG: BamA/TamA family outer membrane protein, partial [Cyclobacteriaceae bacterium]|nr:BamA/TamA family outer membrane protein [Cyclobacteriaceae bacterium]